MTKYEKDKIVLGYVTGIEKYGVFVNLDEFYNGLIHISEISPNFVKNINDYVCIGETIRMKVIDVDDVNHQVKLSIKNINYRMIKKYQSKILETKHGFTTLKEKLPKWIDEKMIEFENNNNL